MSAQRPFVSILTPTYNRRLFFPALLRCVDSQTYPKNRIEWIILDDGTDSIADIVTAAAKKHPYIRYIRSEEKMLIGKKRNILNREAKGEIIVAMDDDDYYPPERVAHVVHMLQSKPKVELAGASEIYMYFADNREIYRIGPYNPNHCTNGTMAYRRSYSERHLYDETVSCGEEKSYLENYIHPMIQLDPRKTMLVISHSMNTFDKRILRTHDNPMFKRTEMKMRDFIRDATQREFYLSLTALYTPEQLANPTPLTPAEQERVARDIAAIAANNPDAAVSVPSALTGCPAAAAACPATACPATACPSLRLAFCDMWDQFNPEHNFFTSLLKTAATVTVTNDPATANIIIYGPFGREHTKYPRIPKVFYTGENTGPRFDHNTVLNLGFEHRAEENYIRLPLWVLEVNWFNEDPDKIMNPRPMPLSACLKQDEATIDAKSKFCAFVATNPGCPTRNAAFEALNGWRGVDSGGRLFCNLPTGPIPAGLGGGGGEEAKVNFYKNYKYAITFENSASPGYTTEKIFHAKAAGCVPIYWGDVRVSEDFDPAGFIDANRVTSAEELIALVEKMEADPAAWKAAAMVPAISAEKRAWCEETMQRVIAFILRISAASRT